jgi:competence protein ComEC
VLIGTAVAALSSALGRLVLAPTAALIEWTWPLFSLPAGSRWSTWTIPALDAGGWLLLLVGVAAAIAPLARATRLAALTLIACVCLWTPDRPPPGVAEVTVLDVGQGLAAVIETRRHVLVYDTGPAFRSGSDAGQLVVLPFLSARGWRHVDALVISHDDADHAGGAPSIVEALPVHRVFGGAGSRHASAAAPCAAGHWSWDGVEFEWLTPDLPDKFGDNDRSCVLLVTAAGRRLLLPGDVESAGERELLAGNLPSVDVVIVPHHGSRSSSSEDFVVRTSPAWAIVSAGYLNRWNFPRGEVVARWQSVGASVLNTADAGAIQFRLGADSVPSPTRWRTQRQRFWHVGGRK